MSATNSIETIRPGEVLSLDAVKSALGIQRWTWERRLRPNLKVIKVGRRKYVRSDDIIALFDQFADVQSGKDATNGTQDQPE